MTLDCDLEQLRVMIESGHGDLTTFGRRLVEVLFGGEEALAAIALALYGVRLVRTADADAPERP